MIIRTPSRIHITLLDLNGSYGRIDGGIGFSLQDPQFILESTQTESGVNVEFDENITDEEAIEECDLKIRQAYEDICNHFDLDIGFDFKVHNAFSAHSGFGSGTQIALAAAKLICETVGIEKTSVELSSIVGRGGTSGIGTYGFEDGGFIADGGHSLKEKATFLPSSASSACPPPLIGRYEFPQEWDVLIAIPPYGLSIHDGEEVNLFQRFCPLPQREVEQLSHIVFMNLIPSMLEKDIEEFGKIALKSKNPVKIAARCTVFAESDLVHKAGVGYSKEDIIAGLCKSIVLNYLNSYHDFFLNHYF